MPPFAVVLEVWSGGRRLSHIIPPLFVVGEGRWVDSSVGCPGSLIGTEGKSAKSFFREMGFARAL